MTDSSKGILGFIFVIIGYIIALFNSTMGVVFIFLFFMFAIIDHYKNDNKSNDDPDNPFV